MSVALIPTILVVVVASMFFISAPATMVSSPDGEYTLNIVGNNLVFLSLNRKDGAWSSGKWKIIHTFYGDFSVTDDGAVFINDRLLYSYRALTLPVKPPGPVGPPGIGPCQAGHEGEPGEWGPDRSTPPQTEFRSPNGIYKAKLVVAKPFVSVRAVTLTNTKTDRTVRVLIDSYPTKPSDWDDQLDGEFLRVTNQGSFGIPGQKPILSFSQRIRRLQSPDGFHIVVFNEESCTMTFPNSRQRKFADTPCQLIMQEDRNLVIYNRAGEPLWASDTANHEEELALEVLDDGRLCLVNEKKECVRWVAESKI